MLEVDFTDADVIFVSSIMFTGKMVAKIAMIARWMKRGSKIVSFHNIANLKSNGEFPEFQEIGECHLPTSWKETSCFRVHEVVGSPPSTECRPEFLKRPNEFDTALRVACAQ
jgi:hypothetical protein